MTGPIQKRPWKGTSDIYKYLSLIEIYFLHAEYSSISITVYYIASRNLFFNFYLSILIWIF